MVIVDFWRNQNNQKGLTPANGISPNFISLQNLLSDSNNSYSTDGPNVINVSNEFMIDLSQLGKTGITNQLALFGEEKLIGWMTQLKMADSSLIAPYSVLLTQLLKYGGFEVHEGLKTKQIVKYGKFMLCGTKGDLALLFFCNDYGINNFLITKLDSPFLQSLQNRN